MSSSDSTHYENLLKIAQPFLTRTKKQLEGIVFRTALDMPTDINELCYKRMYMERIGESRAEDLNDIQNDINGLEKLCNECKSFFLKIRSQMNKDKDIKTGTRFEDPFVDFLKGLGFDAFLTRDINFDLPDIGVNDSNGKTVILIELKYHNAPFIKAKQIIKEEETECYDGSLTIDAEKCRKQYRVSQQLYPEAKYLIAHWIDFPCLKCVLWNSLATALGETMYDRIHRVGDYRDGKQVGWTKKRYHFIRALKDLDELIEYIENHVDDSN